MFTADKPTRAYLSIMIYRPPSKTQICLFIIMFLFYSTCIVYNEHRETSSGLSIKMMQYRRWVNVANDAVFRAKTHFRWS